MTDPISLPAQADITRAVSQALEEDIGSGDITAQLIPETRMATARLVAREGAVLCGRAWCDEVFRQLDDRVKVDWRRGEGETLVAEELLAVVSGPARALMTGERTALNFLQTLSGTATQTREMVARVSHSAVRLLDTRKTIPGLRLAQKYAVRVGGGHNHRIGLFDAYLIKENHILACGGIESAIATARRQHPERPVEIEVRTLQEMERAVAAGADSIMLDNFSEQQIREAVAVNHGRCKLEASGGLAGSTLAKIAETGVDYISVGALTKHCRAVDLSFLLE